MSKKVLTVSIIVIVIILAVVGYKIWASRPATNPDLINTPADNNLPFGPDGINRPVDNQPNNSPDTGTEVISVNALMHLTTDPVAGATTIETKEGVVVRYIERATSHVSDINLTTGVAFKISNTTIPMTAQAYLLNNGSTTILRYVSDTETIKTLSATLTRTSSSTGDVAPFELKGKNLPDDIEDLAVSPSKTQYFYTISNNSGMRAIHVNAKGSLTQIFSSPVNEWIPLWPNEKTLTLTAKAASGVEGAMYFLTPQGGLSKIIGNVNGLTTLTNPALTKVAYSDDKAQLYIYDIKSRGVKNVALTTFSEKCAWSTKSPNTLYCGVPTSIGSGLYPNNWYQGITTFTDRIYKIDAVTGTSEVITSLSSAIDIINPQLSAKEDYLIFTNKIDGTLWSYKLTPTVAASTTTQ